MDMANQAQMQSISTVKTFVRRRKVEPVTATDITPADSPDTYRLSDDESESGPHTNVSCAFLRGLQRRCSSILVAPTAMLDLIPQRQRVGKQKARTAVLAYELFIRELALHFQEVDAFELAEESPKPRCRQAAVGRPVASTLLSKPDACPETFAEPPRRAGHPNRAPAPPAHSCPEGQQQKSNSQQQQKSNSQQAPSSRFPAGPPEQLQSQGAGRPWSPDQHLDTPPSELQQQPQQQQPSESHDACVSVCPPQMQRTPCPRHSTSGSDANAQALLRPVDELLQGLSLASNTSGHHGDCSSSSSSSGHYSSRSKTHSHSISITTSQITAPASFTPSATRTTAAAPVVSTAASARRVAGRVAQQVAALALPSPASVADGGTRRPSVCSSSSSASTAAAGAHQPQGAGDGCSSSPTLARQVHDSLCCSPGTVARYFSTTHPSSSSSRHSIQQPPSCASQARVVHATSGPRIMQPSPAAGPQCRSSAAAAAGCGDVDVRRVVASSPSATLVQTALQGRLAPSAVAAHHPPAGSPTAAVTSLACSPAGAAQPAQDAALCSSTAGAAQQAQEETPLCSSSHRSSSHSDGCGGGHGGGGGVSPSGIPEQQSHSFLASGLSTAAQAQDELCILVGSRTDDVRLASSPGTAFQQHPSSTLPGNADWQDSMQAPRADSPATASSSHTASTRPSGGDGGRTTASQYSLEASPVVPPRVTSRPAVPLAVPLAVSLAASPALPSPEAWPTTVVTADCSTSQPLAASVARLALDPSPTEAAVAQARHGVSAAASVAAVKQAQAAPQASAVAVASRAGVSDTTSCGDQDREKGLAAGEECSNKLAHACPLATTLTPMQQLLQICGQETSPKAQPPTLTEFFKRHTELRHVAKIGEGTYGEAFKYGKMVFKVVPVDGTTLINNAAQKRADEMAAEALVALELSRLRRPTDDDGRPRANVTDQYAESFNTSVCRGPYPKELVRAWQRWDKAQKAATGQGSENEPVAGLPSRQLYLVMCMADCGTDLEKYGVGSFEQARSLLLQVALALAVAEADCEFEHRDLHWGNVLCRPAEATHVTFRLRGVNVMVQAQGVQATLIDFSVSRLVGTRGGQLAYCDLAQDEEMFEGTRGDVQFDTYRLMRRLLNNDWSSSNLQTNALWLSYLAHILATEKAAHARLTKQQTTALRNFKRTAAMYKSCGELVMDPFFDGLWRAT